MESRPVIQRSLIGVVASGIADSYPVAVLVCIITSGLVPPDRNLLGADDLGIEKYQQSILGV